MHIEFIGVPGSGKSSLRKAFLDALQKHEHPVIMSIEQAFYRVAKTDMDRPYRIFLKNLPESFGMRITQKLINRSLMQFEAQNRFLAKYGEALRVFLASAQFDMMTVQDRKTVISAFLEVGSIHECIDGRFTKQSWIVSDEGFIQKSFMFVSPMSVFEDGRSSVYSYLGNILLPDAVIRVKTDTNICYERLMSRPRGLTDRLKRLETTERIHDFLVTSERHLADITRWLRNNKSMKIIEIENNHNIDSALEYLEFQLHLLMGWNGHHS